MFQKGGDIDTDGLKELERNSKVFKEDVVRS